jgi:succinylarginine dihydrolase
VSSASAIEANFDGIVGPTHNYAGLSFGNLASANNAMLKANPREAAHQGLKKMKMLHDMGLVQGVLPPHERPHIPTLVKLGYSGSEAKILENVAADAPGLLRNASAAAAMWTANAATVSPSADTGDGKVHFTPANLTAMFHRSIEPPVTSRILRSIFADEKFFAHHPPLPGGAQFGDEGAANYSRFCNEYGEQGVALFVFGRVAFASGEQKAPQKFPARQTLEASSAIARAHRLMPQHSGYMQQNPAAIDAGAFHNDVVAVANKNVFLYHQQAYADPKALQDELKAMGPRINYHFLEVPSAQVSLDDAVKSYLFNAQLVSLPGADGMMLIVPDEARNIASTKAYLETLINGDHPINRVHYIDVRQSMRNGGGPACLRLRVVLNEAERQAISANVILDDPLYDRLDQWIERHYRDSLRPEDLSDPHLLDETRQALDELTGILEIGPVYDFQR